MSTLTNQTEHLLSWLQHYGKTRINSLLIDERRCIPPHIFLDFGNKGLLGLYVPKQYGGLELPTYDILRILEQLAAIDMSLAVVVNDSILSAYTLLHSSNQAAKDFYLPQIATGRILMANAITEPAAGSDPRKIEATATPDGRGGWLLNGTKLWVGSASWSSVMTVFVKQLDEAGRLINICSFLVPTDALGLTIGHESVSLGMKGFVKNTVTLQNVQVSTAQLLNEPETGMVSAQATMQYIRMCLGMICVGGAKRCVQLMHRYSSRRTIATGLLLDNPVTQIRLSKLITEIKIIDTFLLHTATLLDAGHKIAEEIFIICKNVAADTLAQAADLLIQNLGARGYEETNIAAKIFRDARPFRIFEGPTEVLEMYLGSRVINQDPALHQFINHSLEMPEVSQQLQTLAGTFERQIQKNKYSLFNDTQKTQYWACACMSEVATNLLLMAVLKNHCRLEPQDKTLHHALQWMHEKSEQSLITALQLNLAEKAILSIREINHIVEDYQRDIGDIEQTLPGENVSLDPFLKINQDAVPEEELNAQQWQQVLYAWNNTDVDFSPELTVVELFNEQVLRTPDKIAVTDGETHLTYQQLNQHSTQLAIHLQQLGMQHEDIIAIYLPRTLNAIIAILAVLKAGAAYLPLEFDSPQERLLYILQDSRTQLVITQQASVNVLDNFPYAVLNIERFLDSHYSYQQEDLRQFYQRKSLAYIIYTSGSTGKPKGVMIEHASLSNLACHAVRAYDITDKDRVLQFASLSFDAAAEEIYPALISGAELILRDRDMLNSAEIFLRETKRLAITLIDLPTSYWHQLLVNRMEASVWLETNLRLVIIGGEKLNQKQLKTWVELVGERIRLINTYGPTEATVIATSAELVVRNFPRDQALPIGRPISNTKAYVLNPALKPVPIGSIGELYLGGINLARGYLHQPKLTEKCFILNPFSQDNSRLYRTGDRVYYRADGMIEFVGRVDHQVKVRGFRVEPHEIQAVIMAQPDVQQAYVLTQIDNTGNNKIIAYIVTEQSSDAFLLQLRAAVATKLPYYMIPNHYQVIDQLPLTINGKVDVKALPNVDASKRILASGAHANTPTEKILVEIWEKTLGIAPIGIDENFVVLGGHSLLALQIVHQIKQKCNVEVSIHYLFQYRTIREIAVFVDMLMAATHSDAESTSTPSQHGNMEIVEL